jgi:hypothetical protein
VFLFFIMSSDHFMCSKGRSSVSSLSHHHLTILQRVKCMLNELVWFDGSLKMFLTKTICWTERTFGMVFAFAGCTLIWMELRLG